MSINELKFWSNAKLLNTQMGEDGAMRQNLVSNWGATTLYHKDSVGGCFWRFVMWITNSKETKLSETIKKTEEVGIKLLTPLSEKLKVLQETEVIPTTLAGQNQLDEIPRISKMMVEHPQNYRCFLESCKQFERNGDATNRLFWNTLIKQAETFIDEYGPYETYREHLGFPVNSNNQILPGIRVGNRLDGPQNPSTVSLGLGTFYRIIQKPTVNDKFSYTPLVALAQLIAQRDLPLESIKTQLALYDKNDSQVSTLVQLIAYFRTKSTHENAALELIKGKVPEEVYAIISNLGSYSLTVDGYCQYRERHRVDSKEDFLGSGDYESYYDIHDTYRIDTVTYDPKAEGEGRLTLQSRIEKRYTYKIR